MPWNNGKDFHWKGWDEYSPDIWDNICIACLPPEGRSGPVSAATITSVTIRKGGMKGHEAV